MDFNSETGWVAVVVPFASLFFKCLRSLETPLDKCQKITLAYGCGLFHSYASLNSSGAHAPPPRLTPGHWLFFFFKKGKIPRGGDISCPNAPGWERRKRANALPLVSLPSNTSADFY